jgi:TIR domain
MVYGQSVNTKFDIEFYFVSVTKQAHILDSITSPNIFISYDRRDISLAREVCEFLRDCNCNPIIDYNQILPGDRWRQKTLKLLEESNGVVLLITSNSLNSAKTVQEEFETALQLAAQNTITLIPLCSKQILLPENIQPYHAEIWNGRGRAVLRNKFKLMEQEIRNSMLAAGSAAAVLSLAAAAGMYYLYKQNENSAKKQASTRFKNKFNRGFK